MSTPLPTWLRVVWVVALGMVALLHVRHAASVPGQHRWWHTGHVAMALGMITMYLFMATPWVLRTILVVFCALTVLTLGTAVVWWRRERVLNPLWAASALDALAMVYMALPGDTRTEAWDWVFTVYLGLRALTWAFGVWGRLPLYRATEGDGARVGLSGRVGGNVAISLAVMDASMAYMLVVM